jgi:hypothetical protein
MYQRIAAGLACAWLLPTAAASAQAPPASNPLISAVARCLEIRDDAARLSCSDAAARALVAAERARELVVVDRVEVRRTRRSLFGLPVDLGQIFAGRDRAEDRFEALNTVIKGAEQDGGRWTFRLEEGGAWRTMEELPLSRTPRPGTPVTVRRGALGSYVLKAEGARAVRARRVS